DQSIYRFRGASRASLERFRMHFPSALTVTLGRNHRSSRRIVTAASALIANSPERLPKQLRSSRAGDKVEMWLCPDGATEASAIAAEAERLVKAGTPLPAIAVLCRTHAIARPIAIALAARRLPHVVVGGSGFYDRPEVRDVIALLRVTRNPTDLVALARALTRPPWSLDAASALATLRDRGPIAPLDALEQWTPAAGPASLLRALSKAAAEIDVRDLFFVTGLVEGRLPQSGRSPRFELPQPVLEPLVRGREDVVAEERRLLYVAMTRARQRLYLTRASHYEGGRRWRDSRFLSEVRSAGPRVVCERQVPAGESPSPQPYRRRAEENHAL